MRIKNVLRDLWAIARIKNKKKPVLSKMNRTIISTRIEDMAIQKQIQLLGRYKKVLNGIQFVVSMNGDTATVRLGKRFRVAVAPDKPTAEILAESLNVTIKNHAARIDEIFQLLELKCEQLSLNLTQTEDGNASQGNG
jgi:hypothetical protein